MRPLQEQLCLLRPAHLLVNLRTLRLSVIAIGPTYPSTWTPPLIMSCEASRPFDLALHVLTITQPPKPHLCLRTRFRHLPRSLLFLHHQSLLEAALIPTDSTLISRALTMQPLHNRRSLRLMTKLSHFLFLLLASASRHLRARHPRFPILSNVVLVEKRSRNHPYQVPICHFHSSTS